jgi:glycosyltransferase involved in cell wall biosynthesis
MRLWRENLIKNQQINLPVISTHHRAGVGQVENRSRPLRILYVANCLARGGAEKVITEWATYLQQTEHHVDICTIYSKGHFADRLERQGIKIHNLALDPGIETYRLRRKYHPRVILPLARLIRGGNYHIVHAHLFPTSLFVALASLFSNGQPYIFSEHNVFNRRRRFPFFKLLDRAIYRRYAQIVAVSDEVGQALWRWLPGLEEKIQVVSNAVDPAQFDIPDSEIRELRQTLNINPNDKIVLFVGRLKPVKGVDILLEALANLPPAEMPARVLVVGDGPLKETLKKQAVDLGLEKRVTFLGLRADIPLLLKLADLIVLPSRWEGLPMILLEAMAAQTPVLATPVGGIPEVIEHGKSGWIVPPEDSSALAEGMAHLLQSSYLRARLSNGAFQTLRAQYSTQVAVKKLLGIYYNVLGVKV